MNPKREPVEVVAIVPARAGKQSIHYKNLQKLGGKTLLAWAIEVALASDKIDAVTVSTEDERTAKEAEELGAIVIPRPQEFSQPGSGDAGWYNHAAHWLEEEKGWTPELFVNLRPTSPLRFPEDINNMVQHMQEHPEVDGIKSGVPTPLHPYKMWKMPQNGLEIGDSGPLQPMADFDDNFRKQHGPDVPRQEVQKLYPLFFQDGQIDITRRKFVVDPKALENENVWGQNLHGYVLDPRTSTDLDEPADFIRAEKIYNDLQQEKDENK